MSLTMQRMPRSSRRKLGQEWGFRHVLGQAPPLSVSDWAFLQFRASNVNLVSSLSSCTLSSWLRDGSGLPRHHPFPSTPCLLSWVPWFSQQWNENKGDIWTLIWVLWRTNGLWTEEWPVQKYMVQILFWPSREILVSNKLHQVLGTLWSISKKA